MRNHPTKKLSSTLFISIFAYSLLMIICFSIAFTTFFYFSQEHEAEIRLKSTAEHAVFVLGSGSVDADISSLQLQFEEGLRYTLISSEGQVLFDSQGEVNTDHSNRPEVKQALELGSGSVVRHSETLGEDAIYAAAVLETGEVLRLAEQRPSYFTIVNSIAFPLVASIVLVCIVAFILSKLLTKRITSPLDRIDASKPLALSTYEEMEPLLHRIDEQQQQLKDQNSELARAENLRREFSANVSHEMKSPLQVISGYAELLKSGMTNSDDTQKFAGIIYDESQHMGNLIDDVLTLSRLDDPLIENAGKEPLELLEVTTEIVKRLLPVADNRNIRLRAFGSTVKIVGNRQLLAQLISNLVSNAIHYSDSGGEVTVVIGKDLALDSARDTPEAFVRVKDSGCGIAPDEQEKIFERFYRVDKSRSKESGGTGLGLAIAKHAAEFHGATITVESAEGSGSVFTVHFPLT